MIEAPNSNATPEPAIVRKPPIGKSLSERLEAAPGRYLLLFTAIYLFTRYCENRHQRFWSDEIFTYNLANLPSIRQIWPLIKQGIELNPPLPFWITWIVHHTIGSGEFVTRLPAILGFWGMCVCLFYYVRRRSDTTHGFIALLLPLVTFTARDATWARGYGLLLGFSAAAMLAWQLATDNVRRRLALALLAVSLAGAVGCHYYGLYSAGAIAVGELVRSWKRSRIDAPIFAAIVIGAGSLVAYIPLLNAAARTGPRAFWLKPVLQFLFDSYAGLFGSAAMVLLLFLICTLRIPKTERDWTSMTLGVHEVAACLVFAAMPFILYVASQFVWVVSYSKYVQPVVIGFTIASSMFVFRVGGSNRAFRNLAISFVVWLCFAPWAIWHLLYFFSPDPWTVIQPELHLPDKNVSLPVIIDNDDLFVVAYHYAPQPLRDHLFYLYDSQIIKYYGSDTSQNSFLLLQTFHDIHLVRYDDFVHQNPEFLVDRPRPEGWILQRLLDDGADIQLLQVNKSPYPLAEVFRVKVSPGRTAEK